MANKQFLDKDGVDRLAQGLKAKIPTKVSQLENDRGYKTVDTNTTYAFASGDNNGQIKITPSGGSAKNVDVKGLGTLAFSSEEIPENISDLNDDVNYVVNKKEETNEYTFESNGNPLNKNIIYGNSYQETRSGKNLFKGFRNDNFSVNGITLSFKNENITINGTSTDSVTARPILKEDITLEAGTYTLSINNIKGTIPSGGTQIILVGESDSQKIATLTYTSTNTKTIFTLSSSTTITRNRSFWYTNPNMTYSNVSFDVQIETGNTATSYESYGAMPSPDYPSEVKTVQGIRNLAYMNSISTISGGFIMKTNSTFGNVIKNKTYTLSMTCKSGLNISKNLSIRNYYPTSSSSTYEILKDIAFSSGNRINCTFTATQDGQISINSIIGQEENDIIYDIMLEKGSVAHSYIPYGNWLVEKIVGKNLFDKSLFGTFETGLKYINLTLEPNTTYTMDSTLPPLSTSGSANIFAMPSNESANSRVNSVFPGKPRDVTTLTDGIVKIAYRDENSEYTDEANKYKYNLYKKGIETIVKQCLNKENLFDGTKLITAYLNSSDGSLNSGGSSLSHENYIELELNEKYTITTNSGIQKIVLYNSNKTFNKLLTPNSVSTYTFVAEAKYIRVQYTNTTTNVKILKGTDTTPYYELNKIGNVEDTYDYSTGVLTKRIGKVVLNGGTNETWGWGKTGATETKLFKSLNISGYTGLCSHFTFQNNTTTWTGNNKCGFNSTYTFWCQSTEFTDLATFKTWLSNNNVTVYYVLATPEIIQLDKYHLQTFKGVNNLSIESNIQPSKIDIGYDNIKNICNEVYFGEEEPNSERAMLWVESDDIIGMGTEVVNSLSGNETTMAPSVAAVNNAFEWHYLGETAGSQYLSGGLPRDFNELMIFCNSCIAIIPKILLTDAEQHFNIGGRYTANTSGLGADALISKTAYKTYYAYINGTDAIEQTVTKIYYR